MENDFFWWLDTAIRSLEFEDARRQVWASQVTGASRRQDRLKQRDQVLTAIGEEHDEYHDPDEEARYDESVVPHKTKDPWETHVVTGVQDGHTRCDSPLCEGGHIEAEKHQHFNPANVIYRENSEPVHSFSDGWAIKKPKTFGDLTYEGRMMTNCIREDGESGKCSNCDGEGYCSGCGSSGSFECGECDGSGTRYCEECNGDGNEECPEPSCGTGTLSTHCPHPTDGEAKACQRCHGTRFYQSEGTQPGKIECWDCGGEGKDADGDLCDECEGHGSVDCGTCDGDGKIDCSDCGGGGEVSCGNCEGEGRYPCDSCGGEGYCQECEGQGNFTSNRGAMDYYRPIGNEADSLRRAPGGAYSLRDPDNIPHVSFLHGPDLSSAGDERDETHVHDVLGRENTIPKVSYQHRILQYMKGKLQKETECSNCNGKGTAKTYGFDPEEGVSRVHDAPCGPCHGTGKPSASIGWGYGVERQNLTEDEIDNILGGGMPKPDYMLVARHKDEPNRVETLKDADSAQTLAHNIRDSFNQPITAKRDCTFCGATGMIRNEECSRCGGTGSVRRMTHGKDAFDLYALPTSAIPDGSMEYRPSDNLWRLKDGRGSKVNWDAEGGGQIDWDTLQQLHPSSGVTDPHYRTTLRAKLPEVARELFGKVASVDKTSAKEWKPGNPEYDKADWDHPDYSETGKYRFSTYPDHDEWDDDSIAEWSFEEKGQDFEDPKVPKFNCTHCGMIVPGPADAENCPNCDQPWSLKDVAHCSVHGAPLWDHNSYPMRCTIGEHISTHGSHPDNQHIACPNKHPVSDEDTALAKKYNQDIGSWTDGYGMVHDNFERGLKANAAAGGRWVDNVFGCNKCQSFGHMPDPNGPQLPEEWKQECRFDDEDLSDAAKFVKGQGELRTVQPAPKSLDPKVRNDPTLSSKTANDDEDAYDCTKHKMPAPPKGETVGNETWVPCPDWARGNRTPEEDKHERYWSTEQWNEDHEESHNYPEDAKPEKDWGYFCPTCVAAMQGDDSVYDDEDFWG